MLRIQKWGGMLTAASPYILPPGGAVEQVNAQCIHPGQLQVRGGMTPVSSKPVTRATKDALPILEMWGYSTGSGDTERIFLQLGDGTITQIRNPQVEYED